MLHVQLKTRTKKIGKELDSLDGFSNDQLHQLYELKQEAEKPGKAK